MSNGYKYIWKCAKCANHLANIIKAEGIIKQEKKCPKCKSVNTLALVDHEIFIQCRMFDPRVNGYSEGCSESRDVFGTP